MRLHYSVNGGPTRTATGQASGRAASGTATTNDDYYAEFRGIVTGTKPGDQVEVWFTGVKPGTGTGRERATSPTRCAHGHRRRRAGPRRRGRHRRSARRRAATARQVRRRVRRRARPRPATAATCTTSTPRAARRRTRSACCRTTSAVVWETGDDIIPRAPGQVGWHRGQGGAGHRADACATTSTRAASCCSRGKYARFAQARERRLLLQPVRRPPQCTTPSDVPVPAAAQRLPAVLAGRVRRTSTTAAPMPDGATVPARAARPGRFAGFAGDAQRVPARPATRTTPRRSCRRRASCRRPSSRSSPAPPRSTGYAPARAVRPAHR